MFFDGGDEAFQPRTLWSLSNAFTSAFKKLKPLQQFAATAKLGAYLNALDLDRLAGENGSSNKSAGKLLAPAFNHHSIERDDLSADQDIDDLDNYPDDDDIDPGDVEAQMYDDYEDDFADEDFEGVFADEEVADNLTEEYLQKVA